MGGTLFESTIYKKIIYVHKKGEGVPRGAVGVAGRGTTTTTTGDSPAPASSDN